MSVPPLVPFGLRTAVWNMFPKGELKNKVLKGFFFLSQACAEQAKVRGGM